MSRIQASVPLPESRIHDIAFMVGLHRSRYRCSYRFTATDNLVSTDKVRQINRPATGHLLLSTMFDRSPYSCPLISSEVNFGIIEYSLGLHECDEVDVSDDEQ